jgi:outer membrane receptor for ferrienterochelin and colicin
MKKHILLFFAFLLSTISVFAQNGSIEGKVLDKITNEPLAFVNIVVDGTTIGAVSDAEGNFSITGLNPGFVKLKASFPGYEPLLSSDVQLTNAKKVYLELFMEPSATQLQEVTVKVSPFKKTSESPVSLQRIGLSEIENSPGSNRDISLVIQSFPGVATIPTFRNDIVVRGGGPSENVFYLDDIEIPTINHFATQGASGGAVGIINADLLKEVNFYTGSFPADKGNALSSVFELSQIEGNKEKPKFRFAVGATETSLTVDGPVGEKSSYIMSVRRSYLQFLFDALGLPFLPTFTDYQFKWKTQFNRKNELKIISIGAIDKSELNTGIKSPTEEQEYILSYLPTNNQWNYTIGAVYKHFGQYGFQTFILSRNMLNNTTFKYPENDESLPKSLDYKSQEIENKFRYEDTWIKNGFKLIFSLNTEYIKYNNNTNQQVFLQNSLQNINYQTDMSFLRYGGSVQLSKSVFNEKLALSFGVRADANSFASSMSNPIDQLSPRFSLSYALNPKLSINASIGRYYKLPSYPALGYKDENGAYINKQNGIKYVGSDHIIAGIEYSPGENTIFTIEAFNKQYFNYPVSVKDSISLATSGADFGVVGNEELVSTGKGHAYGFELLNRTRIGNKLNMVASYTYVRSEFKDKNGNYLPTSWDNRNIFTFSGSYNFKKNWTFGAKWRFAGGLPYTPYDMELSSLKSAWDTKGQPYYDYNKINVLRLNSFQQLDVRVDKKFFFRKWSLMLYLDIQNLYNFKADQPAYVVREKDANGNYLLTDGDTRYVLKTISSSSGTVLPTLGIMVEF